MIYVIPIGIALVCAFVLDAPHNIIALAVALAHALVAMGD